MYSSGIHSVHAQEKPSTVYAEKGYLTFDQKPLGSLDKPLVLRTYVPTAGVSKQEVLVNHSKGPIHPNMVQVVEVNCPKMISSSIDGIPAAIAVNLGKTLSCVWDTTECRLLYSWTDGFLDMQNYWGEREEEEEKDLDMYPSYTALFFMAGIHPLQNQ